VIAPNAFHIFIMITADGMRDDATKKSGWIVHVLNQTNNGQHEWDHPGDSMQPGLEFLSKVGFTAIALDAQEKVEAQTCRVK